LRRALIAGGLCLQYSLCAPYFVMIAETCLLSIPFVHEVSFATASSLAPKTALAKKPSINPLVYNIRLASLISISWY